MKYMYIPKRNQKGVGEIGMDCDQKRLVDRIAGKGLVAIHSSGQNIFSYPHIESIILGAGEEVDEVAAVASSMGVDKLGEVGDRTSEA
jgi:hypothetical protein